MPDPSRVCKVYRRAGSPKWREWGERVGQQELAAYNIAASTLTLRPYIAQCFGSISVERVLSAEGEDISDRYFLSTAFVVERVSGEEEKAAALDPAVHPHIYTLLDEFDTVGIEAADASVFSYETLATTRFIDIMTKYGARIVAEVI
jgi:hypothetical protein